ncbi:MAG: InlB B-repeat-containing protein, partial [Oscillospiraceae bacterium]|nr:InlB B-repeat-containing protein [Oscillospiraceae bacterium]
MRTQLRKRSYTRGLSLLLAIAMLISLFPAALAAPYTQEDVYIETTDAPDTVAAEGSSDPQPTAEVLPLANGEEFTVTFVENGGLIRPGNFQRESDPVTGTVTPEDMPLEPTRGGFAFAQWNTEPDASGTMFDGNTVLTEDITVYAQWGFSVRFHGNGGSLLMGNDQNNPAHYRERFVPVGRSVAETDGIAWPQSPTNRVGWVFVGWFDTNAREGGTEFTADSNITGNVFLSARWELAPFITITFNPTLGTINPDFLAEHGNTRQNIRGMHGGTTAGALYLAGVPDPNTTNQFPSVIAPPGSGLIFVGWANEDRTVFVGPFDTGIVVGNEPTSGAIGPQSRNILTEDLTLYAVWAITVGGLGAGVGNLPTQHNFGTVQNRISDRVWITELGQTPTLSEAGRTQNSVRWPMRPDPWRGGATFQYWRITQPASMAGQVFTENTPIIPGIVVTPVWEVHPNITYTLDANGGTFLSGASTLTLTAPEGSFGYTYAAVLPPGGTNNANQNPTRPGYIFGGFYCADGHLRTRANDTRTITEGMTLTARWIPTVTITLVTDEANMPAENYVTRIFAQGYSARDISHLWLFIHDGRVFDEGQINMMQPAPNNTIFNVGFVGTNHSYRHSTAQWQTVRNGLPEAGEMVNHRTAFYEDTMLYPIWWVMATINWNFQSVLPALPSTWPIWTWQLYGRPMPSRNELVNGEFASILWDELNTPTRSGSNTQGLPQSYEMSHTDAGPWSMWNTEAIRGGWNFVGWNAQADGQGAWITTDTMMTDVPWPGAGQSIHWDEFDVLMGGYPGPRNDIFAIWAPGVAFHPGIAPASSILEENRFRQMMPEQFGHALGEDWPEDPIWPGFIFRGWNSRPDGMGIWYTSYNTIYTSRTVYAIWATPVTFHPNGGTLQGHEAGETELVFIERDDNAVIGGAMIRPPSRPGYRFVGWNTAANGSGTTYTRTGPVVPSERLLYAQWIPAAQLEKTSDVPVGTIVTIGQEVTYTFRAINWSPYARYGFELRDQLPYGVTFIPGTVEINGDNADPADYDFIDTIEPNGEVRIRFDLPAAPGFCEEYEETGVCENPGACEYCDVYGYAVVTFMVEVVSRPESGVITNTGRIYYDGEEEDRSSTTITVGEDLLPAQIAKSSTYTAPLLVGDDVMYELVATNRNAVALNNFLITDNLANGGLDVDMDTVVVAPATALIGTPAIVEGRLEIAVNIPANGTVTVTFEAEVLQAGTVTNLGSVYGPE